MPGPASHRPLSHRLARAAGAVALALLACTSAACVSKPTMKLHHAEISGIQIAFPPSVGVLMTVVVAVHNPNGYDVAVRAVRGQVLLASRYSLPVDFRADGGGVWLPSDETTLVRVPVAVPAQLALTILRESFTSPTIPYRFSGRADVTATRTFQLEKDNYEVNEQGAVSRREIEAALALGF